jgi:hypothetical protein
MKTIAIRKPGSVRLTSAALCPYTCVCQTA